MTVMKTGLCVLSALALFGWPAGAEARQLPGRAEVERAVNAWFDCGPGEDCRGRPAFHRRLTRSRCMRLGRDEAHPGRILCIFSGFNLRGGQRPQLFRDDCAYLMPVRRGWVVSSIPDEDMCGPVTPPARADAWRGGADHRSG